MQTGGDFLRVALMIELQQAVKHFSAGCFGNSCRIPDDCIDKNRYPLFMARSVLRELIESLPSTRSL